MSCPYTHRCKQFEEWRRDEVNRQNLWQRVFQYIRTHPNHPYELILTPINEKQVEELSQMKRFVCVREDQTMLLTEEEITQHLLNGQMFEEIYELGRQMELQIRLVPARKTSNRGRSDDSDLDDDNDDDLQEVDEIPVSETTRAPRKRKKTADAPASV
jgi:hypothetical protein